MLRLVKRVVKGLHCAIACAMAWAWADKSSGAYTWLNKPRACASWALTTRPVNNNSLAMRRPTMRGRRCVAPTVPQPTSGYLTQAWVLANTKSQAAMISPPEPKAGPCTTAITGIGSASMAA